MAYGVELSEQGQCAVFDLLKQVRNTIGSVDFDITPFLVHSSLVALQVKGLPGSDEVEDHAVLCLGADVVIAGIVPTADVQAGDVLARLVRSVCGGALSV